MQPAELALWMLPREISRIVLATCACAEWQTTFRLMQYTNCCVSRLNSDSYFVGSASGIRSLSTATVFIFWWWFVGSSFVCLQNVYICVLLFCQQRQRRRVVCRRTERNCGPFDIVFCRFFFIPLYRDVLWYIWMFVRKVFLRTVAQCSYVVWWSVSIRFFSRRYWKCLRLSC